MACGQRGQEGVETTPPLRTLLSSMALINVAHIVLVDRALLECTYKQEWAGCGEIMMVSASCIWF